MNLQYVLLIHKLRNMMTHIVFLPPCKHLTGRGKQSTSIVTALVWNNLHDCLYTHEMSQKNQYISVSSPDVKEYYSYYQY